MKIKRIRLYHFRAFEDLQVQFPKNAQLIVFIGENGSGKSSLLEGISMILQDSLHKYHSYDAVDWNNPLNVHHSHLNGKISVELQTPRHTYNFSQSLSADRTRFVTEERLILEKNRDLTEEERMEHYKEQADLAYEKRLYQKAINNYLILSEIQENILGKENQELAQTYFDIGNSFENLQDYNNALKYYEQTASIEEKILDTQSDIGLANTYFYISKLYKKLNKKNFYTEYFQKSYVIHINAQKKLPEQFFAEDWNRCGLILYYLEKYEEAINYFKKAIELEESENEPLIMIINYYNNVGSSFSQLKDYKEALQYYLKAVELFEQREIQDNKSLQQIYNQLSEVYSLLKDSKMAEYYKSKVDDSNLKDSPALPEVLRTMDKDQFQHFSEYLEVWTPLILHYSSQHTALDSFKDALPIAFQIPMTTNFDLISDWFIEHENEENRKRLRVSPDFRSAELSAIREVIMKGLNYLNGLETEIFTELQTEIEETVKDGQVSSWLSICKNGKRFNVHQLSDGEKRVLVLLIDITRRLITAGKQNQTKEYLKGAGIVLIDEIEQHLHPKWQRMLLPTLSKIFPNIQFIVSTHSPQVLSYVPNGCAFALENGKAYPQNTYGRNNEWILETIMEDVPRPIEVQNELDTYFNLIREDKLAEAAAIRTKLEEMIGIDEPELLKADILIRRKQKSAIKHEANP